MWSLLIIISLLIYILYSWLLRKHEYWARKGVQVVPPVFILGNMTPVVCRKITMGQNLKKCYDNFKKRGYGGFYEFLTPIFLPTNPDLIRDIFVKDSDHFIDRRIIADSPTNDELIKRMLISLTGDRWKQMRQKLTPAFTSSKLRAMFPLIEKCSQQFANFLKTRDNTKPIEFKELFSKYTTDVIATVAFGHECNSLENSDDKFYILSKKLSEINLMRVLTVFGHLIMPKVMNFFDIPFMPREPNIYFKSMIFDAMKYREQNNVSRPDMLQLLIDAKKGKLKFEKEDNSEQKIEKDIDIDDYDIAAQAFLFFLAGFDTVATALSFIAHELAVNLDIQEKLYDEIDSILERNNGTLTYDTVQSMRYLDMVVSETLRKYPPAVMTDRSCTSTFIVPGTHNDLILDKGTSVMLPIYAIHHDPDNYPIPYKFDPERFNDENKKNIKPYTYLPFGIGPHNCIGMRLALLEIKTCLCLMLAACELNVCPRTQVPIVLSTKTFQMTTDAGFWLDTKPRDKVIN